NHRVGRRGCARPSPGPPPAVRPEACPWRCHATPPEEAVRAAASSLCHSGRGRARKSTLLLEQLDGVDVQIPADPAGAGKLLDLGKPCVQEAMQGGAVAAFEEKLRVKAAGALGHGGGDGTEKPHGAYSAGKIGVRGIGKLASLSEECQCGIRCL